MILNSFKRKIHSGSVFHLGDPHTCPKTMQFHGIAWFWDGCGTPFSENTPEMDFPLKTIQNHDFGLLESLFYSPKTFYKSLRTVWAGRKLCTKWRKLFLPIQTGDKQNITLKLPTQSECKIYFNIFENFQKFPNFNRLQKIYTYQKNLFFYFLKRHRANSFISGDYVVP